jgi:hypothetical protein
MGKFPSTFPDGCPVNAEPVTATLYHGCEGDEATEEDFTPYAMSSDDSKQKRATKAGCLGWGLSCWKSAVAARHAQELFLWAAKWHIFKGDVTPDDGELAHTPSGNQPEHQTFWCYEGVSLRERFTKAWPPNEGFGT